MVPPTLPSGYAAEEVAAVKYGDVSGDLEDLIGSGEDFYGSSICDLDIADIVAAFGDHDIDPTSLDDSSCANGEFVDPYQLFMMDLAQEEHNSTDTGDISSDSCTALPKSTAPAPAPPSPSPSTIFSGMAATMGLGARPPTAPTTTACSATAAAMVVTPAPASAPAVASMATSPVSIPRRSTNGAAIVDAAGTKAAAATRAATLAVSTAPTPAVPVPTISATAAATAVSPALAPAPAVGPSAASPMPIPRCSATGASSGDAAMTTREATEVVSAAPAPAVPAAACSATAAATVVRVVPAPASAVRSLVRSSVSIPCCLANGASLGDAAMTTAGTAKRAATMGLGARPPTAPTTTACSATAAAMVVTPAPAPAPAVASMATSPVSIPRRSTNGAAIVDAAGTKAAAATRAATLA
ncbi:unnamed protein product, partial [Pylaiella littoralis]